MRNLNKILTGNRLQALLLAGLFLLSLFRYNFLQRRIILSRQFRMSVSPTGTIM